MPVYSASISLNLPALEAGEVSPSSSPFPVLTPVGPPGRMEVETIVLENDYVRAAIAPGLGGRLVSLYDKRFQVERLGGLSLGEGKRGARLVGGVELSLDGRERLNAMGPVDVQVLEDEDAVILAELASGSGMSWHLRVSLVPGRASLQIAVRIGNRTLEPVPYRGGLIMEPGVMAVSEPGVLEAGFRSVDLVELQGRQVDSWTCELVPTGLMGGVGSGSAVSRISDFLEIEALEPMLGHTIAIHVDGETLSMKADLYPERLSSFSLERLPQSVAILSPEGEVVHLSGADESYEAGLRRQTLDAGKRGAAYVGLAMAAARKGDFEGASASLDDAITFNGDDPLAWWFKAALARRSGETGERPELLNAHFLAPLEPMLRAEAFLSTPVGGRDASPLVAPLAEDPDAMVEVACTLSEAGLREDLARWVDECLRHREVPMLRFVLADALVTDSRMGVEAAHHVRLGCAAPALSPRPWRRYERDVLTRLAARFPEVRLPEVG